MKGFSSVLKLGVILILILSSANLLEAQKMTEEEVPKKVMIAFRKSYPVIRSEWVRLNGDVYEVSFKADGDNKLYYYDSEGRLKMGKTELNSYPRSVTAQLNAQFPGWELEAGYNVRRGSTRYIDITIKVNGERWRLKFDEEHAKVAEKKLGDAEEIEEEMP